MTTSSTERGSATRQQRPGPAPASGAWLAAALVAIVALLGLPQDAAAKYGSSVVTRVATAGRGAAYLTARPARPAEHRETHVEAAADTNAGRTTTPHGDRRGTAGVGSYSSLGNGVVLARSAPQIAVMESGLVFAARDGRVTAASSRRADEFQHASGQAHRLRGPPALLS